MPQQPKKLSRENLLKIEQTLKEVNKRKEFDKLAFYQPYPKQRIFHNYGDEYDERMFMAANRIGKSYCGSYEVAMHATGRYPSWWKGRRFDRAVKIWACSDTSQTTRDIVQTKLCGQYGQADKFGSGSIPRECVDWEHDVTSSRGIADAFDTVLVKHDNGGKSVLTFKSYEQGRKKFQGDAVDVIWDDEEPPMDVYSEELARLAPTRKGDRRGTMIFTATPLDGMTELIRRYKQPAAPKPGEEAPKLVYVQMGLEEAEHIDEDERKKLIASYPEHERDARVHGEPMLGEGRIFPYPDSQVSIASSEWFNINTIPNHWAWLWALDFGTGHPFAAVLGAWDKDADIIYLLHTIKMVGALPLAHCDAMKSVRIGGRQIHKEVPCAWPRDGHARRDDGQGDLKELRDIYKKHGMLMLPEHSQWEDGSVSTEAGIVEMQERMTSNRLKVLTPQPDWFQEYRGYHRKDGLIVKVNDDVMSASRIWMMSRRYARPMSKRRGGENMAKDVDFDLF